MSVVATRVYEDRIVIAADSILCGNWSKSSTNDFSKLHQDNGMIIGSVGYAQEGSLMWHYMSTHKPASATEKSVLEFIIEFARWKKELGDTSSINNSYILAFGGKVFAINDMFVTEISEYHAIGAGRDYANAALYLGHTPQEAVKVACALCCFVAEPIIEYTMVR